MFWYNYLLLYKQKGITLILYLSVLHVGGSFIFAFRVDTDFIHSRVVVVVIITVVVVVVVAVVVSSSSCSSICCSSSSSSS